MRIGISVNRFCQKLLEWAPLVAMPFMLNLRWSALIAPNEEPKWAVLVLLGLIVTMAGAVLVYLRCREPSFASTTWPPCMTLPGMLFLLYFIGLACGVTYAINLGMGINRLAFWWASGATFVATARAVHEQPAFPRHLQWTISISALLLCSHFWYGFFVDFHNPNYNKFVQFSRIGHFNFTADVLMVLIPLLTWTVLTTASTVVRGGGAFSLATAGFMLITSGSLGGMGGLAGGGVIAAGLGLTRRFTAQNSGSWRLSKRGLLSSAGAALLLAIAAKPAIETIPADLRKGIFVRAEWAGAPSLHDLGKSQTLPPLTPLWTAIMPYLGSRTPMWAATAGMVAAHPWRGFGTGSFFYEYPGFNKRFDLFADFETLGILVKTNPHNILLQVASENGIPMMALFAGLYGWLTYRVMRQAWREPNAFWLCGVWALWAVGLDAQVNHVFFNPASLYTAAIAFGLLQGGLPVTEKARLLPLCPLWRSPIMPALAGTAAVFIAAYPLRWVASEYFVHKASRLASSESATGVTHAHKALETAIAWSPYNADAIYGLASVFYPGRLTSSDQLAIHGLRSVRDFEQLSEREQFQFQFLKLSSFPAYNLGELYTAEKLLKQFLKLCPYHSAGLNLLGTLQARQGRLDEAEQTLNKALGLEPKARTIKDNIEEVKRLKAFQGQFPPNQAP